MARFIQDMIGLGVYTGISTHSYDGLNESDWATLIQRANGQGQPVWHTEISIGAGGRFNGAEPPITSPVDRFMDFSTWYRQGVQGGLFFELWSRGVDSETRAVYFTRNTAGVRLRAYYLMKQFANNAADSTYIPSTSTGINGVEVMSFRQDNKLIVWITNGTDSSVSEIPVNLNGARFADNQIDSLAWAS